MPHHMKKSDTTSDHAGTTITSTGRAVPLVIDSPREAEASLTSKPSPSSGAPVEAPKGASPADMLLSLSGTPRQKSGSGAEKTNEVDNNRRQGIDFHPTNAPHCPRGLEQPPYEAWTGNHNASGVSMHGIGARRLFGSPIRPDSARETTIEGKRITEHSLPIRGRQMTSRRSPPRPSYCGPPPPLSPHVPVSYRSYPPRYPQFSPASSVSNSPSKKRRADENLGPVKPRKLITRSEAAAESRGQVASTEAQSREDREDTPRGDENTTRVTETIGNKKRVISPSSSVDGQIVKAPEEDEDSQTSSRLPPKQHFPYQGRSGPHPSLPPPYGSYQLPPGPPMLPHGYSSGSYGGPSPPTWSIHSSPTSSYLPHPPPYTYAPPAPSHLSRPGAIPPPPPPPHFQDPHGRPPFMGYPPPSPHATHSHGFPPNNHSPIRAGDEARKEIRSPAGFDYSPRSEQTMNSGSSSPIKSVADWQKDYLATGRAPSAHRCVPLKGPIPSKYWGDKPPEDSDIPDFHCIVNYPDNLSKARLNQAGSNGKRNCVMCGKLRLCSASAAARQRGAGGRRSASPPTGEGEDETKHIIPRQNKGLCTSCDVTIWVFLENGVEIKWCKGCKNFRPWASFGDKGSATKCTRCRTRQREKYAMQKEDLRQKRLRANKQSSSESNDEETASELQAAKGLRDLMAAAL